MKTILLSLSILLLFSCKKEEISASPEVEIQTQAFTEFIKSGTFQLVEFYSDIPIDYNPSDANTQKETQLWGYVLPHVKDDHLVFGSEKTVKIIQNAVKHNSLPDAELSRPFSIASAKNKTIFNFVDYNYTPLQYVLHKQTATSFIVYVQRDNAKLYSKFEIME